MKNKIRKYVFAILERIGLGPERQLSEAPIMVKMKLVGGPADGMKVDQFAYFGGCRRIVVPIFDGGVLKVGPDDSIFPVTCGFKPETYEVKEITAEYIEPVSPYAEADFGKVELEGT